MTAIQSRLDIACPLPWPKDEQSFASTSYAYNQSSPIAKREDRSKKEEGVPLLISEEYVQGANEKSNSSKESDHHRHVWIQERYFEILWLGEYHSPLSSFLSHLSHLKNTFDSAQQTAEALRSLLRSRSQIRQRYSEAIEGSSGWSDKEKLIECIKEERLKSNVHIDALEASIVQIALKSGAATVVAKELQESKKEGIGSFGKLWIDAIESRELQLQVIVILCLLQLNAENPDLFKESLSISKDDENTADSSQTRRRKRKAEKSHRWTGVGSIFPWQMGKTENTSDSKDISSIQTSSADCSAESLADPKALSKRFEGMIDLLCLRVATTNISLSKEREAPKEEGISEKSDRMDINPFQSPNLKSTNTPRKLPQTPGESPAALARKRQIAGHAVIIPPFGSEGRRKDNKDERDVLQWFCNLIETQFAKSLPRQCGILRSRCFISTASTPAKRPLMNRQMSKNDAVRVRDLKSNLSTSKRLSKNDLQSMGAESISTLSQVAPVGALQRSLLNEDKSKFQRTQSFAAAKQKSTWDAREVNVRKRWERSQSVGPSNNVGIHTVQSQAINSLQDGKNLYSNKQPIQQSAQVIRRKEISNKDGKERNTFTLVLDTPSKPRPIQNLPIRRKTMTANSGITQSGSHSFSQLPLPMKDRRPSTFGSNWQRSDSQPVFTSSSDSIFGTSSANAISKGTIDHDDEEDLDDGTEKLDESLRQAFNETDEEDDFDEDQSNIFGAAFSDW